MRKILSLLVVLAVVFVFIPCLCLAEGSGPQKLKWVRAGNPEVVEVQPNMAWKPVRSSSIGSSRKTESVVDSVVGNQIMIPSVWFGQWENEDGKYVVNFFAQEVNPKYKISFSVNDSLVSWTKPMQTTQVGDTFELIPSYKEATGGVYIPSTGKYNFEVKVYLNKGWYFLYQQTIIVPPFEIWLSSVCLDDQIVDVSFTARSFFSLDIKEGDIVDVKIGEYLYYSPIYFNERGEAMFDIAVGAEAYGEIQYKFILSEFSLPNGEVYSQGIYYREPWDCSEELISPKG